MKQRVTFQCSTYAWYAIVHHHVANNFYIDTHTVEVYFTDNKSHAYLAISETIKS